MAGLSSYLALSGMLTTALAGFFPPASQAQNATSKFSSDITVSSVSTDGLCETTPNVKSYSGYVSTSASLAEIGGLPGYPLNTFYWFFESRNDPANSPFVLWHGGGPGFTGVASAVFENGPCNINNDSNSTTLNPYSWTEVANILYIDSPSMVGYSYDVLTNATVDGLNASLPIIPADFATGAVPSGNNTFQVGTFGSQNPLNTANSTGNTSPLVWATLQAWFSQYPQYLPANGTISMWSESYGGHYMPAIATFFQQQNGAIEDGSLQSGTVLNIDTVGIVNGFIDPATHVKSYPAFVNNNTYGIQTVPPEVQASMQTNLTMAGGCLDAIDACNALAPLDATNNAANTTIDAACAQAFVLCEESVQRGYVAASGRSQDDVAHPTLDPFPPEFYVGFFNQAWVQAALGAPVNFTANSGASLLNFVESGDGARPGTLGQVAQLLDAGVQVTLIYGDRDYQVNWFGGEEVSLLVNHTDAPTFRAAGYANFTGSDGTWAGSTRQAGAFSFTRVFQAGHSVPAYQPAAALDIFTRAMAHKDVATGLLPADAGLATQGPASVFDVKNAVPDMPLPVCYTWEIGLTCTPELQQALVDGTAFVHNFIATNGSETEGAGAVSSIAVASPAGPSTVIPSPAVASTVVPTGAMESGVVAPSAVITPSQASEEGNAVPTAGGSAGTVVAAANATPSSGAPSSPSASAGAITASSAAVRNVALLGGRAFAVVIAGLLMLAVF